MSKLKYIAMATLLASIMVCGMDAIAGSCSKQGSSTSIDWIKQRYKNCTNCGTQKNGGKTVYYCYCGDGCGGSSSKSSSSSGKSSSSSGSSGSSCKKYGSSSSINTIKSKYSNCVNCGTQQNNGKTVYYCYCGSGCKGSPGKSDKQKVKDAAKDVGKSAAKGAGVGAAVGGVTGVVAGPAGVAVGAVVGAKTGAVAGATAEAVKKGKKEVKRGAQKLGHHLKHGF